MLVLHRGGVYGVRGAEICVVQSMGALSKAGYDVIAARSLLVDGIAKRMQMEALA